MKKIYLLLITSFILILPNPTFAGERTKEICRTIERISEQAFMVGISCYFMHQNHQLNEFIRSYMPKPPVK